MVEHGYLEQQNKRIRAFLEGTSSPKEIPDTMPNPSPMRICSR
jgi:hypothetical protein